LISEAKYDAALQASLCAKLVKADFSGAKVKVVNSKNPSMIGVSGIVVRESPQSFVVIQPKNDAVKVLLKAGSVFQFQLPAVMKSKDSQPLAVNIWGDSILYKGSERTKIKFKEKYALELF
jgi:ribonuclease P protein subunit POP4